MVAGLFVAVQLVPALESVPCTPCGIEHGRFRSRRSNEPRRLAQQRFWLRIGEKPRYVA
jgi:hypothetical protein